MHEIQANALAVRRRLMNLPNGRSLPALHSSAKVAPAQSSPLCVDEVERAVAAGIAAARVEWKEGEEARLAHEMKLDEERLAQNCLLLEAVDAACVSLTRVRDALDVNIHTMSGSRKNRQIMLTVCRHYGSSIAEMCGRSRLGPIVRPRHVAMYLLRHLAGRSYPEIGRIIGGRDHTTTLSGVEAIEAKLVEGDEQLAADIAAIKKSLGTK